MQNSALNATSRVTRPLRSRARMVPRCIALPPKQKQPVRSTTALTAYALGPEGLHRPIHEELVGFELSWHGATRVALRAAYR